MTECFRCGISGEKARLSDAISESGIVMICSSCNAIEKLPIIKRATTEQIKQSERQQTVREKMAGFTGRPLITREPTLRDIVDRNYKEKMAKDIKPRPDLIDNFNWVIMRERRLKHISRDKFAKDLGESETSIRMIESGILPEDDNRLINKIEAYLGIILRKPGVLIEAPKELRKLSVEQKKIVSDENLINKNIFDLKGAKKKQEEDLKSYAEAWGKDEEEEEKEEEPEKEEKGYTVSEGDIDEFF